MPDNIARRRFLRASVGGALALAGLGPALPALGAGASGGNPRPELPEIPGMHGDRLANEFWYQFDELFMYDVTPEVADAFTAIDVYCASVQEGIAWAWLTRVGQPGYPGTYADWARPIAAPLRTLSRLQFGVFDTYYRRHDPRLDRSFGDFGQGVLYDPRRLSVGEPVHTGFGDPPETVGYLFWWVHLRAMMMLGIDTQRWREMAPRVAYAWAVQEVAKPSHQVVNPPLPERTLRRLAATWLTRSVRQLDDTFAEFPYTPPPGTPPPQTLLGRGR
jgi:hypothetical protein